MLGIIYTYKSLLHTYFPTLLASEKTIQFGQGISTTNSIKGWEPQKKNSNLPKFKSLDNMIQNCASARICLAGDLF